MNVAELRKAGARVRIIHHRRIDEAFLNWDPDDPIEYNPALPMVVYPIVTMPTRELREAGALEFAEAKGGFTEAFVQTPDGVQHYGRSVCSLKDGFCKKVGVELAIKRALNGQS